MRILFAGTPSTAADVLEGLISSGHEIVAVLTREDSPVGRKKILTPSAVAEVAEAHGLPTIKANKVNSEVLAGISKHQIDLAIVVAYGVILRRDALDAVPKGWFNLHFSKLPRWRGAAPVQHAIWSGDKETAVTLFKIDEGLDTGHVLGFAETVIEPDETSGELLGRLSSIGVTLLNQELPKIYAGTFNLSEQQGAVSLAPKIQRVDARINFTLSSREVENLVRAMNPEPMAWCELSGDPLRVSRARAVQGVFAIEPGEVLVKDDLVLVGCGSESALELIQVQPASKTPMSAKSWMNGQSAKVVLE
jgi:methionyl-tRNA formyltransferase